MARIDTLVHFLTDVADAIRNKTGSSASILAENFDTEIANIPSGGTTPTIGFVVNSYDSNGFATDVTITGMTIVPDFSFCSPASNQKTLLGGKVETITLPNNITRIGSQAFQYCSELTSINLPSTLTEIKLSGFAFCNKLALTEIPSNITTIGGSAFLSCSSLAITKIPSGVTSLGDSTFKNCTSIKKVSIPGVTELKSSSTNYGVFNNCTGLKAVWIGSSISTIGRYVFTKCTGIEKIYIDLPRATVEAFTNYQYAFSSTSSDAQTLQPSVIICNDDNNFISLQDFDALVIE